MALPADRQESRREPPAQDAGRRPVAVGRRRSRRVPPLRRPRGHPAAERRSRALQVLRLGARRRRARRRLRARSTIATCSRTPRKRWSTSFANTALSSIGRRRSTSASDTASTARRPASTSAGRRSSSASRTNRYTLRGADVPPGRSRRCAARRRGGACSAATAGRAVVGSGSATRLSQAVIDSHVVGVPSALKDELRRRRGRTLRLAAPNDDIGQLDD